MDSDKRVRHDPCGGASRQQTIDSRGDLSIHDAFIAKVLSDWIDQVRGPRDVKSDDGATVDRDTQREQAKRTKGIQGAITTHRIPDCVTGCGQSPAHG